MIGVHEVWLPWLLPTVLEATKTDWNTDMITVYSCKYHLTYVHTFPYTSGFSRRPANQLCLGDLAYRGYRFWLDERLTEKVKCGFAFRMYGLMPSSGLCRVLPVSDSGAGTESDSSSA
jgi:hypothetical protein